MYFNSNNNHLHGIMFHHFHDGKKHLKGQGSISKKEFISLIKFIGRDNILNADDFFLRLKQNKLKEKKVCFTFDDSLKCQLDIALPVMEDFNIKAFFFVYTNIYESNPCLLEAYRYFRMNYYSNVNDFYNDFYKHVQNNFPKKDLNKYFKLNRNNILREKKKYQVHTLKDIEFRYIRTFFLNEKTYKKIMIEMFSKNDFNYKKEIKKLFFSKKDLLKLYKSSHFIGLHSHSHPTKIENLSHSRQIKEYKNNKNALGKIIGSDKILSMSHPHGSYNPKILKELKNLNIEIGFDNGMKNKYKNCKANNSNLEISREDHSMIMRRIKN